MSDLLLNLRIWYYHFQIKKHRPWVRISFNRYRAEFRDWRPFIEFH